MLLLYFHQRFHELLQPKESVATPDACHLVVARDVVGRDAFVAIQFLLELLQCEAFFRPWQASYHVARDVVRAFLNQRIERKKKVAASLFLLFYLISFYVPVFNIAMHGGTVTNWFNYRDSFEFCFFLLMTAAEEWNNLMDEPGEKVSNSRSFTMIFLSSESGSLRSERKISVNSRKFNVI